MQKQISFRDIRVNYHVAGAGEVLFLIHGFCEDLRMWTPAVEVLSKYYKVITPDLPGYGGTTVSAEKMSIVWMAEMMDAIATAEGVSRSVMMGHSLGGYVSVHYEALYPGKTRALGFINSHVFADDEEKKANRLKSIAFIEKHSARLFIRELINNLFAGTFKQSNDALVRGLISDAQAHISDAAVIATLEAMANRADKREVLKQYSLPVLFLIGQLDETIPLAVSMEQVGFCAQCDIHVRAHVAHMSMYEDSDYSIAAILAFMQGLR